MLSLRTIDARQSSDSLQGIRGSKRYFLLLHASRGAFHKTPAPNQADRVQSLRLQYCPNCDPPRVMTMKSIRPAMWSGHDQITFQCRKCRYEEVYTMK